MIPYRREIIILVSEIWFLHNNIFFVPIPILKNNLNTLMNENIIDFSFSFSIPTFQTWPKSI